MPQVCVAAVGIYWYWNVHVGSIHFNGYEYGRKIKEKAKDLYYKKYIDERNQRLYKQMERYTTSSDQKNQYCQKTILHKVIYRFNVITIKLPMTFFFQRSRTKKKKILKFLWKYKRPWVAKAILRKKTGAEGIRLPGFRLYYEATIIKAIWYSVLCGSLDGRGVWGRMDTCICMAESLRCSPETITALFIS